MDPTRQHYYSRKRLVRQHDTTARGVLDRVLRLSHLSRNTTDRTTDVVAVQQTHVFYLKRLCSSRHALAATNIQIVQTEQRHRVVDIKPQHEGVDVVLSLLQASAVHRVRGRLLLIPPPLHHLQLHTHRLRVEANQQLQLVHHRTHQLLPIVLERRLQRKGVTTQREMH